MVQQTTKSLTKPISINAKQDKNRNHYIRQPPVETVQSFYSNIVSRRKKNIVIFIDSKTIS